MTAAKRFLAAAFALWSFARYRSLTWELAKRDVLGRYRGASLGLIWALLVPLMMVAVFSFAFGEVLRAKWPASATGTSNFALILFAGLIVHGFLAECLIRSPTLVVGNPNYVKRIIFPLEILPWPMVLSALFHLTMNFMVFIAVHLVLEGPVPWTIVLLPLVVTPLVVMATGLAWLLAATGVYFRDINQVTGPVATALLFLSSAIIPVATLPESHQAIFNLNPLTFIIDQVRNVSLWGVLPNWEGLGIFLLWSIGFAYFGSFCFQSARRGFADVV